MVYDHPFFCFMISLKTLLTSLIVFLAMAVVFAVYWPGLAGGFIFDDYYSLQKLAILNGQLSFSNLWSYVMAADTGPLKRPVSVLSFILNAHNWPVDNAFWFKLSNVMIHALNTLFLIILLTGILKQHKYWQQSAFVVALAVAMLWSLNPYLVSTVLYVVQRMAMLPLSFGLLLLIMYLYQRRRYQPLAQTTHWLWVTGGLSAVLLLLATLSKENGILFIYLLVLFEILICRQFLKLPALNKRDTFWLIKVPVFTLTVMLVYKLPDFLRGYDARNFNLWERLLTEFRVVSLYLKEFLVPASFSQGVFVDGYVKSTGLFTPITTLTSLIFVFCLMVLAILLRHRFVWFSFALGFFFVSQLLESTFVPLELIFEHRVYIASVFLPAPIVLVVFKQIRNHSFQIAIILLLLSVLAVMTYQKSKIWGHALQLHLITAQTYPESTRASVMSADLLSRQGQQDLALQLLNQAAQQNKALELKYSALLLQCDMGLVKQTNLQALIHHTREDVFTKNDEVSLHYLLEKILHGGCEINHPDSYALKLVDALKRNSFYAEDYGWQVTTMLELFVRIETNDQAAAADVFTRLLKRQNNPIDTLNYIDDLIKNNKTEIAKEFYHLFSDHYLTNRSIEDYNSALQEKIKSIQALQDLHEKNHQ